MTVKMQGGKDNPQGNKASVGRGYGRAQPSEEGRKDSRERQLNHMPSKSRKSSSRRHTQNAQCSSSSGSWTARGEVRDTMNAH